jgi:hypothetical protein
MNLTQFRSLSPDIQRKVVQHTGVFLFGRTGVGVTAKLYQIGSFYVELFFNEKRSELIRIVSFDDTHKLEPYLRLVNVAEIQPYLSDSGAA